MQPLSKGALVMFNIELNWFCVLCCGLWAVGCELLLASEVGRQKK